MIRWHILFIAVFLFLSSLRATETLDGIVAVVGDSVILSSELDAYMFLKINQLGLKPDSLEKNMLRYKLLDELIEGKVLLVYAEKDTNIIVTSDEIESELGNRINYILHQNHISMKEFEALLEKEQGISLTKFKKEIRQQIRQELLKQKVQQFYISSLKINRSDVEHFYTEYRDSLPAIGKSIRFSKISVNCTPSEEIRQKAYSKITSLKEMLDNGEDFTNVAKRHSEGPNALNGGDLGYIGKGTLNELAFEEKIFSLKPGETSEPFETRLGFHIVQILERKDQKVHVRQLFTRIAPPEQEIQQTLALLDSIKAVCTTKQQFIKAVKKFSTDDASKARNGQLHWQTISELNPQIKSSFDTLIVGTVSSPVKTENSISLYRIDAITKSRVLTLADDWNEIAQIAQRIFTQKKLIDLVNKWQRKTFIDIRL